MQTSELSPIVFAHCALLHLTIDAMSIGSIRQFLQQLYLVSQK
jgi:hypothetical protein